MSGACSSCVTRARLLAELGPVLDRQVSRRARLLDLLSLPDEQLIAATGGARRARLLEWRARPESGAMTGPAGGVSICRHSPGWPAALDMPWRPAVLTALGGRERLATLLARPVVALLGAADASAYGRAMAARLARGMTAAGATVVAGLTGPFAQAVHEGAAEAGGSLALAGSGLDPRQTGGLAGLVLESGCLLSELPWAQPDRRWGPIAAERLLAGLAAVAVVVECRADERELWAASLCRRTGAVPGMVTNPLAGGPHTLIKRGARLIARTEDVLDLLHDAGAAPLRAEDPSPALPPELRRVAELVGAGADTPERLAREPGLEDGWATLAALGMLEARGALRRTEHGGWVRLDPAGTDELRDRPRRRKPAAEAQGSFGFGRR